MNPVFIVIGLEFRELTLQVNRAPKKSVVKILATNGSDEPLDERMRLGQANCVKWLSPVREMTHKQLLN